MRSAHPFRRQNLRQPNRKSSKRTRSANGRRLCVEGLEQRQMLSATTAPQVLDINTVSTEFQSGYEGTFSSSPHFLQSFQGEVYFGVEPNAYFPNGSRNPPIWSPAGLWKTDGTAAGTTRVDEFNPDDVIGLVPRSESIVFNNQLYFTAEYYDADGISATGEELWKTDGLTGTERVTDIWFEEGSSNPRELTVFNGELYFSANEGTNDSELWKTDGTEDGTVQVKDINPGGESFPYDPYELTVFNNELFFAADDGINGYELWKSDGTAGGTVRVKNVNPSGESFPYEPYELTIFNNELYFAADDCINGYELWKTDGTASGTVLVANINSSGDSFPDQFTVADGELYFTADDGETGKELWKTDGSPGNAVQLANINSNGSSNPSELTVFNNELYFLVNDSVTGVELSNLWKTDGTIVGTMQATDVHAAGGFSNPTTLSVFNDELYFIATADDVIRGGDLWKTDGTSSGTQRQTFFTLNPRGTDFPNGIFAELIAAGDFAIFSGNDGVTGLEPWVIRIVTPASLASIIGDLPAGTTEVQATASPSDINAFLDAIAVLAPNGGDVIDIVLQLDEGDYEGAVVNVPTGYRVTINGETGQVVFHGASPSLTLQSGDLRVNGVTFVNTTDAPSVLVQGGTLTVRNSLIQETTGGVQSAIEIGGGSVDLGTISDPGGNTFEVSGLGGFVRNLTVSTVPVVGNLYLVDGMPLSSEAHAVPEWMKLAVDGAGSGVSLVGAFSLTVTLDDATWEIGTPFPVFAVQYDGFVHGDDESVLAGDLQFVTDANQSSTVGTYAVEASGQSSNKYEITYVDGTLTVTPAIVRIDLRPTNLNIDQNGAISLVIFGSSTFDVSQVSIGSLTFAGVSIDVFNHTLVDADQDGRADLLLHFQSSDALKAALTQMYSDLLIEDYGDDDEYSTKQDALITLDGAFGEFGQEFAGSDTTNLFLAGKSLKSLLQDLGIST